MHYYGPQEHSELFGIASVFPSSKLGFNGENCTDPDLRTTLNFLGILSVFSSIRVWVFLGNRYKVRPVPSRPPHQELSVDHMWPPARSGSPPLLTNRNNILQTADLTNGFRPLPSTPRQCDARLARRVNDGSQSTISRSVGSERLGANVSSSKQLLYSKI